jgi:hypothetical protein
MSQPARNTGRNKEKREERTLVLEFISEKEI